MEASAGGAATEFFRFASTRIGYEKTTVVFEERLFNFSLRSSPEVPFLNAQIWALLCDVDVETEFVLFFNRKSLAVRLNIPFLSLRWKQGKICIYGSFSFCEILLEVCINGYGHGCQKTMGNGLG